MWGISEVSEPQADSVNELGIDLCHVPGLTGLNDLNGLLGAEESVHRAGSWLLEIFVVLPVIGGFLFPVITL